MFTPQFIEKIWPYAAAVGCSLIWAFGLDRPFPKEASELLSSTGTAASVLVGFLVTAKAIILSLTGSAVFLKLVESGFHQLLFSYLYEAVWAAIALLVVSIVGFFISANGVYAPVYQYVWILSSFGALFLFIRISSLLFNLLRQA